MFNLNDIHNIEEDDEVTREDYCMSIQVAINSNMWSLQGSYGHTMMEHIQGGLCMLGLTGTHDAYGNYIPSRFEVLEGTKGSRSFVIKREGEDWADMMESVGKPDAEQLN